MTLATIAELELHAPSKGSGIGRSRAALAEGLPRAADVTLAALLLVFLAPLLLLIALAVKLHDGGPVFFSHLRVGANGQAFPCFKFRSMVTDSERRLADYLRDHPAAMLEWQKDHKLRHDPRITRLGRFLRKSSLDELPQLFNVLRGEMSLVGPRPIVHSEVARYGRYIAHYCSVRPGITGLWQVMGRNDVSYRRRVALDVVSIKRKSAASYFMILALTLPAVLCRKGVY